MILEEKTDGGNKAPDDLIPEVAAGATVSLDALDKVKVDTLVSCGFSPKTQET